MHTSFRSHLDHTCHSRCRAHGIARASRTTHPAFRIKEFRLGNGTAFTLGMHFPYRCSRANYLATMTTIEHGSAGDDNGG